MTVYQRSYKKRYATSFHLPEDEWAKMNAGKLKDNHIKEVKSKLALLKLHAEAIIDKIIPFSFVGFEELFFLQGRNQESLMLSHRFDDYIGKLKANDQMPHIGFHDSSTDFCSVPVISRFLSNAVIGQSNPQNGFFYYCLFSVINSICRPAFFILYTRTFKLHLVHGRTERSVLLCVHTGK